MNDNNEEKSSDSVSEVGDASRDNCLSVASMSTCSELCKNGCCDARGKCQYEKAGQTSDDAQSTPTLGNVVPRNDERDSGVCKVSATTYGSNEWSKMSTSMGSSMARCRSVSGATGMNAGDDSMNDCLCSFCLKAAHILSDLQYQDIKASNRKDTSDYCKNGHVCCKEWWTVRNCSEGETGRQSNVWVLDA